MHPSRYTLVTAAAIAAALTGLPATAATFVVDTTSDAVDADPGDGVCATAGGACSLRAATQEANALPGEDLITIPAGVYTLSIAGANEDDGATGDLDVSDTVVIEGDAAATTIVDGAGIDRVFDLGADTTIRRLTIRGGDAPSGENGGGVRATPFVQDMTAVLEDVLVTGNDAGNGGGIANELGSTLVLRRSTLTDNTASVGGGGLDNDASDGAVLENVTISDNFALNGDGMRSSADLTATHVTVAGDQLSGTGITLAATLLNRTIGDAPAGSCAGATTVTSLGGNLEFGTSCGLAGTGDQSGVDPLLLPLGDYGGETTTHALGAGSPAIDAAPTCALDEDQRGVVRPQDGDSSGAAACDTGAFEAEPGVIPTTTVTTPTTTTSTTLPDCTIEATFASAACRITSLQIRFDDAAEPVKVATKTGRLLTKAGDRLPLAEAALDLGKTKKAKRHVAKSRGATRRFAKRLGGKKGPKIIADDAIRSALASDASTLEIDLLALRDSLQ